MRRVLTIYTLFLLIFCGAIWLILYYPNLKELENLKQQSSGTYKVELNLAESSFTEKEVEYYQNVRLKLDANGEFSFSKSVPIGRGSLGQWKIEGDELERHVLLLYSSGYSIQISTCHEKNCVVDISIPIYTENVLTGYKYLPFRKFQELSR